MAELIPALIISLTCLWVYLRSSGHSPGRLLVRQLAERAAARRDELPDSANL
jgi:hypothetical protein